MMRLGNSPQHETTVFMALSIFGMPVAIQGKQNLKHQTEFWTVSP